MSSYSFVYFVKVGEQKLIEVMLETKLSNGSDIRKLWDGR